MLASSNIILGFFPPNSKVTDVKFLAAEPITSLPISGDPVKIGEVVRDLFRKNSQAEQSYSERQMFQVAIERLAREVAAVEKTDYFQSTEKIETILRNK